jgi:hypothetical protein
MNQPISAGVEFDLYGFNGPVRLAGSPLWGSWPALDSEAYRPFAGAGVRRAVYRMTPSGLHRPARVRGSRWLSEGIQAPIQPPGFGVQRILQRVRDSPQAGHQQHVAGHLLYAVVCLIAAHQRIQNCLVVG